MRPTSSLVALGVAFVALAGCSDPPATPAEIVIESQSAEVRSSAAGGDAPAAAVFEASASARGHIAGVVVDEAIRPIEGAQVRLPGMNQEQSTRPDGSFGFVDLYPAPYLVTIEATGYDPADAMLEVQPGEFTRAKVILTAIPPPEPYHVTQSFEGYTELTGDPVLGFNLLCTQCDFDFYVERTGLYTVIFEATSGSTAEGDGFYATLRGDGSNTYLVSGMESDPMRIELRDEDLGKANRFELKLEPTTLVPATARRFQVFVTAFYNEAPPVGWSIVRGDL